MKRAGLRVEEHARYDGCGLVGGLELLWIRQADTVRLPEWSVQALARSVRLLPLQLHALVLAELAGRVGAAELEAAVGVEVVELVEVLAVEVQRAAAVGLPQPINLRRGFILSFS